VPESPVESALSQLTAFATDALNVAVGFGVLTFQRVQVRRRELEARLSPEALDVVRAVEERAGAAARDLAELVTSLAANYVK
jgi:hypothetical protein